MSKIVFLRTDSGGRSYFSTSKLGIISSSHTTLFANSSLAEIMETTAVRDLRKTYLGKRLWSYGSLPLSYDRPGDPKEASGRTNPLQPVKLAGIYQLAHKRVSFHESGTVDFGMETSDVMDVGGQYAPEVFVFVFSPFPNQVTGMVGDYKEGDWLTKNYGPPYCLVNAPWTASRRFSLRPPEAWARRAIVKLRKATFREDAMNGMTHREVAWAYGWPWKHESFAKLLKEQEWDFEYDLNIRFKGDRVVSVYRHLPH